MYFLGDNSGGHIVDTAFVLATDKFHVSVLTPACAPGVTDDPVLNITLCAITNNSDAVVERSGRAKGVVDALSVERPIGGINTHRNRPILIESSNNGVLVRVDSLRVRKLVDSLSGVIFARRAGAAVSVISLGHHTVLLDVLKGDQWETTVAALVAAQLTIDHHAPVVAVNKLLIRELGEDVVGNKVRTLEVSDGREGPARAAGPLILDIVHSPLDAPVEGVGIRCKGGPGGGDAAPGVLGGKTHGTQVGRGKLGEAHVGKFVEGKVCRPPDGVERLHELVVGLIVGKTLDVLLGAGIEFPVGLGPTDELGVEIVSSSGGGCSSCNEKESKFVHYCLG